MCEAPPLLTPSSLGAAWGLAMWVQACRGFWGGVELPEGRAPGGSAQVGGTGGASEGRASGLPSSRPLEWERGLPPLGAAGEGQMGDIRGPLAFAPGPRQ